MLKIRIEQDEYADNPRTAWDNLCKMALFHKRYSLGDKDIPFSANDFNSWESMQRYIQIVLKAYCLPVYLYDHSGLTIRTTPFSCPWDSGQLGFVYVTKAAVRDNWSVKRITTGIRQLAFNAMHAEVASLNAYVSGEVYGWIIEDENGEHVESCWGYYDLDDCKQQAQEMLASLEKVAA